MTVRLEEAYSFFLENPTALEDAMFADIHIDDRVLGLNMQMHAEKFLYWGRLASYAYHEHEKARVHMKTVVWPAVREVARKKLEELGGRITNDALADSAYQEQAYVDHKRHIQMLELMMHQLQKMETAMHQRMSLLQSLNSRQGKELDTIPHEQSPPQDLDILRTKAEQTIQGD